LLGGFLMRKRHEARFSGGSESKKPKITSEASDGG